MLVLTRKSGESLFIGQTKVIVEQKGVGEIRVIIDAPDDVVIRRAEIPPGDWRRPATVAS